MLEQFLEQLANEIESNLSANTAISLYDIIAEFSSDEEKFELKIAEFFARTPDKLKLCHSVIGKISLIRHEIKKGGNKTLSEQEKFENFFINKASELNAKWQK